MPVLDGQLSPAHRSPHPPPDPVMVHHSSSLSKHLRLPLRLILCLLFLQILFCPKLSAHAQEVDNPTPLAFTTTSSINSISIPFPRATPSPPSIPQERPRYVFPDVIELPPSAPKSLKFGILLPLNLSNTTEHYWRSVVVSTITAVRLAVEDINAQGILPLNISLSMRSSQSPASLPSSGSNAMLSAASFVYRNVSALIGDSVSALTEYSAALTSALRIPQCSSTAISSSLSNTNLYSHFIRTVPTGDVLAGLILKYIRDMGWHRIGIVYTQDSFGRSVSLAIIQRAPRFGITIVRAEHIVPNTSGEEVFQTFRELGSYINILLSTDEDLLRALEDIYHAGIFKLPYTWITLNNIYEDIHRYFSTPERPGPSNFDGLIMTDLQYAFPGYAPYDKFLERWSNLDPAYYPGAGSAGSLRYGAARGYSCAWMLALGYQKDIKRLREEGMSEKELLGHLIAGTFPRTVGKLSAEQFSSLSFDGPAGNIELDQDGDPVKGSWEFHQLQKGRSVKIAEAYLVPGGRKYVVKMMDATHSWPGLAPGQIPVDAPPWVLQNLTWHDPAAIFMAVIAGLGIFFGFLTIVAVMVKRNDPVIKAASPFFCVLEIVGIILSYASVLLQLGVKHHSVCYLVPLVCLFGFSVLVGSLVVKNFRIFRIFNNVFHNKYALSNTRLFRQVAIIVVICMTSPVILFSVARPTLQYVAIEPDASVIYCKLSASLTWPLMITLVITTLLPIILLLASAAYLSFRTQNISGNWNEARAIAYATYNIIFGSLVCIPTMFLTRSLFKVSTYIQNIMVLFVATVCMVVLFLPKFVTMRRQSAELGRPASLSSNFSQGSQLDSFAAIHSDGYPSDQNDYSNMNNNSNNNRDKSPIHRTNSVSFACSATDGLRFDGLSESRLKPSSASSAGLFRRHSSANAGEDHSEESVMPVSVRVEGGPELFQDSQGPLARDLNQLSGPLNMDRSGSVGMMSMATGTSETIIDSLQREDGRSQMGVFSFGSKDRTQTIPVLLETQRWYSSVTSQWRAMEIIIVASLNMVILIHPTDVTSETYIYNDVESVTEEDHYFLKVSCLQGKSLKLEFPSNLARDQWLQAFKSKKKFKNCDRRSRRSVSGLLHTDLNSGTGTDAGSGVGSGDGSISRDSTPCPPHSSLASSTEFPYHPDNQNPRSFSISASSPWRTSFASFTGRKKRPEEEESGPGAPPFSDQFLFPATTTSSLAADNDDSEVSFAQALQSTDPSWLKHTPRARR